MNPSSPKALQTPAWSWNLGLDFFLAFYYAWLTYEIGAPVIHFFQQAGVPTQAAVWEVLLDPLAMTLSAFLAAALALLTLSRLLLRHTRWKIWQTLLNSLLLAGFPWMTAVAGIGLGLIGWDLVREKDSGLDRFEKIKTAAAFFCGLGAAGFFWLTRSLWLLDFSSGLARLLSRV